MILAWDLSRGCSQDVSQSGRALRVALEDLLSRRLSSVAATYWWECCWILARGLCSPPHVPLLGPHGCLHDVAVASFKVNDDPEGINHKPQFLSWALEVPLSYPHDVVLVTQVNFIQWGCLSKGKHTEWVKTFGNLLGWWSSQVLFIITPKIYLLSAEINIKYTKDSVLKTAKHCPGKLKNSSINGKISYVNELEVSLM